MEDPTFLPRHEKSKQGVDQSWMQDPIPPVLFNLVNLALIPGHGQAKGASG